MIMKSSGLQRTESGSFERTVAFTKHSYSNHSFDHQDVQGIHLGEEIEYPPVRGK